MKLPFQLTFDNRVVFHCKLVFYYRLDYGHLTYSSVQFFLFIDLFVVPVTISKLTATKYIFQKDYTWLNKLHRMFQNWNAVGVFTWTEHLLKSFDVILIEFFL